MTTILLVGAGAVGRRAARQLAESDGVDRILIADRSAAAAADAAEAMGDRAEVVDWSPDRAVPSGVGVVASAIGGTAERAVFERAVEAGVPAAGSADDGDVVRRVLDLDDAAREAGVALAAGCGMAPGLADVLARHASDAVEIVDEIHVARAGSAGPACRSAIIRAGRGTVPEWRDGAWLRHRAGSGRQLVWFPSPVGGLDCHRAGSGQAALLVDAFPTLRRATMRIASPLGPGRQTPGLRLLGHIPAVSAALTGGATARRRDPEGDWGAVWVEVRGRRGRSEEILVYGAVDRMAFASGAVLAVAALWLAGIGAAPVDTTGAHGLATLVDPVPFLGELARRGVKAAVFEGASV
ncbi:MAG TPA: saccharopine dehydrogenase NADP-binding domain-containing protein [Acidimicrobiia bacterium]|nr:saccharopine dehydrogenase NADP-binding domain-containing protein [Acidimicrobiia bacterium]